MTHTGHSDNSDSNDGNPPSLLPYDEWIEEAYRGVMLNALSFAAENGLPGDHNFYLTFKTDYIGVEIPNRLQTKYPEEMTIVLQHQFWDLKVDRIKKQISVGLSFGGVGTILIIPFGSIIGFADPSINLAFTFHPSTPTLSVVEATADAPVSPLFSGTNHEPQPEPEDKQQQNKNERSPHQDSQIISLDAFRKNK